MAVNRDHPASHGEKIRVFIGTEPKTEIARKVLQFSIQRRTAAECEFTPMIGPKWEYRTEGIKQGTGFSLRRWMIPQYCGWNGRAIYLDADMLVFGDLWELWSAPDQAILRKNKHPFLPGCSAWLTYQTDTIHPRIPAPQTSVMVIDCQAAKHQRGWHFADTLADMRANTTRKFYHWFMHGEWMDPQPCQVPSTWNALHIHTNETRLLHYTHEPDQPWYNPNHPLAPLWKGELIAALAHSAVTPEEVRAAIAKFGRSDDHRKSYGMHPDYAAFITPEAMRKVNNNVMQRGGKRTQSSTGK